MLPNQSLPFVLAEEDKLHVYTSTVSTESVEVSFSVTLHQCGPRWSHVWLRVDWNLCLHWRCFIPATSQEGIT